MPYPERYLPIAKNQGYPLHPGGNQVLSTLDHATGYWQVKLDEATRPKSAFTIATHHAYGLFEFVRMPFGVCNTPATFQQLMQVVLECSWLGVGQMCLHWWYFGGLKDHLEEHLGHLWKVFARLVRFLWLVKLFLPVLIACKTFFLNFNQLVSLSYWFWVGKSAISSSILSDLIIINCFMVITPFCTWVFHGQQVP